MNKQLALVKKTLADFYIKEAIAYKKTLIITKFHYINTIIPTDYKEWGEIDCIIAGELIIPIEGDCIDVIKKDNCVTIEYPETTIDILF